MNTLTLNKYLKTILLDAVLLAAVYLIPTISHLTSLPLYMLEPMRIILFACVFLSPSRKNVYIMAVTLPLFSFLVAGHPIIVKNVIMAIELLVNVAVLYRLLDSEINPFVSCALSILASKILYYIMKFAAISFGLLATSFVDTAILTQAIITLFLSVLFLVITKRNT